METKDLSEDSPEEEQIKIKIEKELDLCRNQSFIVDLIYVNFNLFIKLFFAFLFDNLCLSFFDQNQCFMHH